MRRLAACLAICLTLGPAFAQETRQPEETFDVGHVKAGEAQDFMVAAAHPLAAGVGYDILGKGGTAADAAVAVQLMLNLVEPQSSGIGGGAFALYYEATTGRVSSWDGRETAPLAAGPDYWLKPDGTPVSWPDAVAGGRSVGVPGTLLLLEKLHQRFGQEPWGDLVAPAMERARSGFEVSPRMAASIKGAARFRLGDFPAARAYFFDASGTPLPAGHLLKNPEFAETLQAISARGSAAFYEGALAEAIVSATTTAENPGILTGEDFTAYRVKERKPACLSYRGFEVCGMGPPSSGGLTVGQALALLERFDLKGMGPTPEAYHLIAEASKLAFADRGMFMADSDFVAMPEGLLDRGYLAERSGLIDPKAAMNGATPGNPPWKEGALRAPDLGPERAGTSHFVAVDRYGNAISMTTTIEIGFGSRLMVGGFLLNNELTDFSLSPARDGKMIANRVEGGKRPRSSMAPTIVLKDGKPVLLTGSPGGSRIIGYTLLSIIAVLDWEMSLEQAVARGHVVNRNGATDLEEGTEAADLADRLVALGHEVKQRNLNSGLHMIAIGPSGLKGAADPRREGVVLGD